MHKYAPKSALTVGGSRPLQNTYGALGPPEYSAQTLSVYRSRFEALPSIGSSIFAEHTVKRSNNATDNGHIYARGFVNDCYGLGCAL